MMFRKIYWVTEEVDPLGFSHVSGVYTSIPELIRHGLTWDIGDHLLRLTLTKLDSDKEPFGVWCEPNFGGIAERLEEFIETDEISLEHSKMLVEALKQRSGVPA